MRLEFWRKSMLHLQSLQLWSSFATGRNSKAFFTAQILAPQILAPQTGQNQLAQSSLLKTAHQNHSSADPERAIGSCSVQADANSLISRQLHGCCFFIGVTFNDY